MPGLKILNMPEFDQQIRDLLVNNLKRRIKVGLPKIENEIKAFVSKRIKASPEWKSLQSGQLASEMGLVRGSEATVLDTILNQLINSTQIKVKTRPTKTRRGIKMNIEIESADLATLQSLPAGRVISSKGNVFEWLDWLLFRGDKVVIGYALNDSTSVEDMRGFSRSKQSIMRKNRSGRCQYQVNFLVLVVIISSVEV